MCYQDICILPDFGLDKISPEFILWDATDSSTGSGNGLVPVQHQANTWTNDD